MSNFKFCEFKPNPITAPIETWFFPVNPMTVPTGMWFFPVDSVTVPSGTYFFPANPIFQWTRWCLLGRIDAGSDIWRSYSYAHTQRHNNKYVFMIHIHIHTCTIQKWRIHNHINKHIYTSTYINKHMHKYKNNKCALKYRHSKDKRDLKISCLIFFRLHFFATI